MMRLAPKPAFVILVTIAAVPLWALASQLEIGASPANNAGWDEVGQGSASSGGISDNTGESGWPSMTVDTDNNPYVAWYDDSSGDKEIYVRRWNGSDWVEVGTNSAQQGGISNNSSISTAPSIAAGPKGEICVAWRDFSSGFYEIYLRCWNGTSWSELGNNSAAGHGISNQQGNSSYGPALAFARDGTLYAAWDNNGNNSNEIYVARWTGSTWERLPEEGSASNTSGDSWLPSLAIAPDGTPYVAWQDETSADSEIYVRRWNGSAWVEVGSGSASGGGISRNSGNSGAASIVVGDDGTPYVAWRDDSSGNMEIYVRRWNGSSWVESGLNSATGGGISQNVSYSTKPSLVVNDDYVPCVAWQDRMENQNETYVRCRYGTSWLEVDAGSASDFGISHNSGQSSAPVLAITSDGRAFAAWGDNSSGNYEIYVRGRSLSVDPPPTATSTATATNTPTATETPLATAMPTDTAPPTQTPSATPRPKAHLPFVVYQAPPTATPTVTLTPMPTPTRRPIFVGLEARWDGRGFIDTDEHYETGTHQTIAFTEMIDSDIVKSENRSWYDPNPKGWASEDWLAYYSVSSGEHKSSSQPSDPVFKWGYFVILPYRFNLIDGEGIDIDGQEFRVSGPFDGVGAFGQRIRYWRMVNLRRFLYADSGNWTQYVHPGDITMEYDVNTRLLLERDVLRRAYYKGDLTQYTVQYIEYLTSSNAYPGQVSWNRNFSTKEEVNRQWWTGNAPVYMPAELMQPAP